MAEHVWEASYAPGVRWDVEFPSKPVYALFDEAATRWPDNYICDFLGRRLTYREMQGLVDRATKGLQDIGIGKGSRVGLFLPNTPHYLAAFFAILKAGGTVVNLSPLDAPRELAHKIEDSGTETVITLNLTALYPQMAALLGRTGLRRLVVGQLQEMLPFPKSLLFPLLRRKEIVAVPDDARHVPWSRLLGNDGRFRPVPVEDLHEEVAALQYTGGTTGIAKGAMLTHANLVAAEHQCRLWTEGDAPVMEEGRERVLAVLPLFHIYALTVVMLNGIRGGAELILHPRFELQAVVDDIARKKPTNMSGVPTMYMAILGHPRIADYDLSSLKFCTSGGAPLPVEVQEQFEACTGCKLIEGWGMTETCAPGCSTPLIGRRKKGSAGVPVPGCIIEIVDVDDPLRLLPLGSRGEICVRGPQVMKGYWNQPEATAEAFAGGRLHTGDVGYMDEDGFVYLVDRKKDMIISGGFNVYPRNIEDAIYEHPAVQEVTVIGIPDDYRGQSAKAFIKLRPGAEAGPEAITFETMKEFLKDKLGKHEMPTAIEIRDELPKTAVGKLSKKELVEEEMRRYRAAKESKAAE